MITTRDLTYPVIVFRRQGPIEVMVDEDTLTTATGRDLKIGWWDRATVVDSAGKIATVRSAKFVSGKGLFLGYTILLDRIIRIELLLEEQATGMPLEQLRRRILRELGKAGQCDGAVEVRKAHSIRELIAAVLPIFDARMVFRTMWRL